MPQVSREEYELRIEYITELIMSGIIQRQHLLKNYISKFELKESQFNIDLREARKRIKEVLEVHSEDLKAELVARYNVLFTKNMKIQDYRECRAILDSLAKLGGLFIDKKEITGNVIKVEAKIPDDN